MLVALTLGPLAMLCMSIRQLEGRRAEIAGASKQVFLQVDSTLGKGLDLRLVSPIGAA